MAKLENAANVIGFVELKLKKQRITLELPQLSLVNII